MPRSLLKVVYGFALLWLLLVLLHPSPASAKEPAFTCQTITSRSAADILLADLDEPNRPIRAVHIVPGETLCLQGELGAGGQLGQLRLLDRATADEGWMIAVQLLRDQRTTLVVRHGARHTLTFGVLTLNAERKPLAELADLKSAPRLVRYDTWGPEVDSLLLGGFFVADLPSNTQQTSRSRPFRSAERRAGLVTFGAWLGERWTDYGALDSALVADGFAPLPRTRVLGGFDMDLQLWRYRLGVSIGGGGASTQHSRTGEELKTWLSEINFNLGYDFWRHRGFTLFATAGFSIGNLFVDSRTDGLTLWNDRIEPWEGDRVNFSHTLLPIDVGAEYLVPFARSSASEFWALQFGSRLGWRQQLGGHWTTDEQNDSRDIDGGPDVSLSGPIAKLVLGIGLYAAPRR